MTKNTSLRGRYVILSET